MLKFSKLCAQINCGNVNFGAQFTKFRHWASSMPLRIFRAYNDLPVDRFLPTDMKVYILHRHILFSLFVYSWNSAAPKANIYYLLHCIILNFKLNFALFYFIGIICQISVNT